MSGIAGIWTKTREIDERLLRRMQSALRHRGPNDEGIDILPEKELALVHTRLSVIDLSTAGHQPMWSENRVVGIVYDGDIYNSREFRKELEQLGCQFRSMADTEVILHGYERWGVKIVHRLNGVFALAIWDGRRDRLWLVRDRLGETPRYYRQVDIFVNMQAKGGMGKAVLEAMACGLPCILCTPAFNEQLGNFVPEVIFREEDAEDLAQKLVNVLDMRPEYRRELGRLVRRIAAQHSVDSLMERIVAVFATCVQRGQ